MGKEGMGIGSASIVLIFAVLCLTIFALISLALSENDKALIDANSSLVEAYYEADTLAEYIMAELFAAGELPGLVRGIEIKTEWDWDSLAETAAFSVPVTADKELYVKAAFGIDGAEILSWTMRDIRDWQEEDEILNVWQG